MVKRPGFWLVLRAGHGRTEHWVTTGGLLSRCGRIPFTLAGPDGWAPARYPATTKRCKRCTDLVAKDG